jgi:ribonuclease VapC
MIIDSSAIVAIALLEPAAPSLLDRIEKAAFRRLSVANYVETASVLASRRVTASMLDDLLADLGVELYPFDEKQAREAVRARVAYGKGTGHRAQLNFGDTFAYALAKVSQEPLLFIGDDFTHTDIALVEL